MDKNNLKKYVDDFFKDLDACVHLASMDGSIGVKGTVMDAVRAVIEKDELLSQNNE